MKRTIKLKIVAYLCLALLTNGAIVAAQTPDLGDAISALKICAGVNLAGVDYTGDNQVGLEDAVYVLRMIAEMGGNEPGSIVGDHAGIFFRDGGDMVQGQSGVFGQMPFALTITSESPLEGVIDNVESPENELGYYSLYFPEDTINVTFLNAGENEMAFEIQFTTDSPNLSPDSALDRTMTFEGQFSEDKRVLSGTYSETISGFKDNQGNDIPINLTGKFALMF